MEWNNTFNVTVSDVNYPKLELQQLTSTNNLTQTTKTHITEKDRETPLRHYLFSTSFFEKDEHGNLLFLLACKFSI